ncbi:MAG: AAA family ATPase [Hyphomicrobiaceae bacterium]
MSVTDIERGLVAAYAARVLRQPDLPLRSLRQIVTWLNDRVDFFGLPMPKPLSKAIADAYQGGYSAPVFEKALTGSRQSLIADLERIALDTPAPAPLIANVTLLCRELGLDMPTTKLVCLIAYGTRYDQVRYFAETVAETIGNHARTLSILVGEPVRAIEAMLTYDSEAVASGLLQVFDAGDMIGPGGRIVIPHRINRTLDRTFESFAEMRHALLGDPLASNIEATDYDHLAADRDLIQRVLAGALGTGARGVNILLYGPPGTGKTELSKVATSLSGATLYGAGEDGSRSGEADRTTRLADLVFSLRLLTGSAQTALLFDEMEDVAWQLMKRGGSKVYLNRLLETNPVPIFWTSNNVTEIDPALLRRMTLAVEMRLPPASQRRRILARQSERMGLSLSGKELDGIARKVAATPAVLENALRAAKLAGGGAEDAERAALGVVRAVTGMAPRRAAAFPDFVPDLMTANLDLIGLADQLVKSGNLAFSLCLSGPPGTGKSAFARYLARRLGLEVIHKRASDLLGAFVGESEKRIAEAFEEAREAGAFLVFDEADSFLQDRRDAVRSWEVTQVNEMLTWMEEHTFPVCFTTNLVDRFDTASLRRFTFHIRFDYLARAGLERAYLTFFKMSRVPPGGLAFTNLTPGDFAQARKQAVVLGILGEPERIVELIADIARNKPGARGSIGFVS